MRKPIILILLTLLLVSCNQSGAVVVPIPTRAVSADVSPRTDSDSPAAPGLPPTWTPSPLEEGQHLPEGAGANQDGGSDDTGSSDVTGTVTHVVQAGETLGEIATQYGVSLSTLADINDILNIDVIEVGDVLLIPSP
jgi:nucleoid-associated protein YgaU